MVEIVVVVVVVVVVSVIGVGNWIGLEGGSLRMVDIGGLKIVEEVGIFIYLGLH